MREIIDKPSHNLGITEGAEKRKTVKVYPNDCEISGGKYRIEDRQQFAKWRLVFNVRESQANFYLTSILGDFPDFFLLHPCASE